MKTEYKRFDGIEIYHPDISNEHMDYNASGLTNLYNAENTHFWFISRKEFIFEQFKSYSFEKTKLIEIGAGTGNVTRYLMEKGYQNVSVGEMHLSGLEYAKTYGVKNCYQFDLLRSPFENEFDTVCMFDVLEHIEDANLALNKIHQMLTKNGHAVFTVPAHSWLWNRDDKIASHKKRYTKKEMVNQLERSGFKVEVASYFFISIVPLLFLRTLLNQDSETPVSDEEYTKEIKQNRLLNAILLKMMRFENRVHKFLPNWFGGSLFIIGKKI
ncbi:hypothetical protein BCU71_19315 [Vibrio lentus]|uniref:class I SAM-dependent methyltransferase n=1 Tax=Vibrio lentus TaxID=136468 RepID=UPI000C839A7B|nr:class I SAM-dependent methyltransferase [Vibrio lentus]PMH28890.1 hypothetical protein BCU71_19315 [Vibrio lentus]PMK68447.1 hypothetical protein BCT93_18415 [Vibrio lentus]